VVEENYLKNTNSLNKQTQCTVDKG